MKNNYHTRRINTNNISGQWQWNATEKKLVLKEWHWYTRGYKMTCNNNMVSWKKSLNSKLLISLFSPPSFVSRLIAFTLLSCHSTSPSQNYYLHSTYFWLLTSISHPNVNTNRKILFIEPLFTSIGILLSSKWSYDTS